MHNRLMQGGTASGSIEPRLVLDGAKCHDSKQAIRVVVIDDHRIITDLLETAMRNREQFEFCGSVSCLSDLSGLLRLSPPDVALIDARLPDGSGIDALRRLRARWPHSSLLMFTGSTDPGLADEAVGAGADGLISKEHGVGQLLELIARAASGETLFPLELLQRLNRSPRPTKVSANQAKQLISTRERASLQALLESGHPAIAASRLNITESTLRNHLHAAITKLGASSRLEAISIAWRCGLIQPPNDN